MRKLKSVNIKAVISVIRNFTDSLLFQVDYRSHFAVTSEDTWHATKFYSNNGTLMCLTNRGQLHCYKVLKNINLNCKLSIHPFIPRGFKMYCCSFYQSQGNDTQDFGQACVIKGVSIGAETKMEASPFGIYTARCSQSQDSHRSRERGQLSLVVFPHLRGLASASPLMLENTQFPRVVSGCSIWRIGNVYKKLNSLSINWLPEGCSSLRTH